MTNSIKINSRLDIRSTAHIMKFLNLKGLHITSASQLVQFGIDFLSEQLEKNGITRPATTHEAVSILEHVLTDNMKTKTLFKELSEENFLLDGLTDNQSNDNQTGIITSDMVQRTLKELKKTEGRF